MKWMRATAAAVTAAALAYAPSVALAAAPTVPEQGHAIYLKGSGDRAGACTIGFNDTARRVSYTAGHCGERGARVQLLERETGYVSEPMGTFYPSVGYDGQYTNDWGEVRWDAGVKMGGNRYSGDRILEQDDIEMGDQVCFHGEATHTGTRGTTCGTFHSWINDSFTANIETWRKGDSGGPVWVPGRGLVGIASAGATDTKVNMTIRVGPVEKKGAPVGWGVALRNGAPVSSEEFFNAYVYAAGFGDGWVIFDPPESTGGVSSPGVTIGAEIKPPAPKPAPTPTTPKPAPAPAPVEDTGSSPAGIAIAVIAALAAATALPLLFFAGANLAR